MKITLKSLGISAFLTSFIFFVSLFAVHVLKTDFNPVSKTYSDYVLGSYGYIVSISLVSVGVSQLLLATGFHHIFRLRTLTILFILSGFGGVITGVFPTTSAKDMNFLRTLHIMGSTIQFGFLPWGFIYLSGVLPKGLLKSYYLVNGILTFSLFSLFASLFLLGIDKKIGYFGMIEKIDIFLLIIGLLITSSFLIASSEIKNHLNKSL